MEWPKWPNQTKGKLSKYIYFIFGQVILPILFHSKLFQTIQLFNPTNHSIPFYFFSTFFFNFPNSYTISLNLNHLYHLEIHKIKPFNIFFFQTIPNHFQTIFPIPKKVILSLFVFVFPPKFTFTYSFPTLYSLCVFGKPNSLFLSVIMSLFSFLFFPTSLID